MSATTKAWFARTDVVDRFPGDDRAVSNFRLSDFDWNEVRTLDAGSWFWSEPATERSAAAFGTLESLRRRSARASSKAFRIPTLIDALALTADLDWLVNVEIKSFPGTPPGLTEAVLEAIARTGTWNRVSLSSFDHSELGRIPGLISPHNRDLLAIPRGVLAWTPLFRPHAYLAGTVEAQTYHVSASAIGSESIIYRQRPSAASLSAEGIEELKAAGIPILVYTVNDVRPGGLAEHLAELGISALFTDDPQGMRRLFG